MKPNVRPIPKQQPSQIDRINRFKGVNLSVDPTQLEYNESPDMLNMVLDTEGALDKRTGYALLFDTPLNGTVWNMHRYRKTGTEILLVHAGTKLYTFKTDGTQPTEIYSGMANARSNFFNFTDKCYIQDGTNYLEYDGSTVKQPEPYIPTLFISTPPEGGGTSFEDFNLLGSKFKQSFSGNGTAKDFQLALGDLDATPVTALVDMVEVVEGTNLTVNRTTGKVTFTTAPSTGTPNNVVITASKASSLKEKITRCRMNRLFGGTNDTRVFVWSGQDNVLYRSDTYRANYFPENSFQRVGADAENIQNLVLQYDSCVIEKEFSKWIMRYEFGSVASFPVRPINDTVGSIAPYSSQIIENSPVTLTKNGVYLLQGSSVRDERNVSHQSNRVDKKLLAESNLKDAITIDFDSKYFIVLNGNVYVWDYLQPHNHPTEIGQWVIWDNINATCLYEIEARLYFGDVHGNLFFFKNHDESFSYRDVDDPIKAYWKSKTMSFRADERYKTIRRVFTTIKPGIRTSVNVYYLDEQAMRTLIDTINMTCFSYEYYSYEKFTYISSDFPQVSSARPKIKKITHFQIMYENNVMDESLGIINIGIENQTTGFKK